MRATLAGLLFGLSLVGAPASACDCDGPNDEAVGARLRLSHVVRGRVREVEPDLKKQKARVTLLVAHSWKGAPAGKELTFELDTSDCGFELVSGDDALIFAPTDLVVEGCAEQRSARVSLGRVLAADTTALGPPLTSTRIEALPRPGPRLRFEGKVEANLSIERSRVRVRVVKAMEGTKPGELLVVESPVGDCAASLDFRMGDAVVVTGYRMGEVIVVSSCFAGSSAARP